MDYLNHKVVEAGKNALAIGLFIDALTACSRLPNTDIFDHLPKLRAGNYQPKPKAKRLKRSKCGAWRSR